MLRMIIGGLAILATAAVFAFLVVFKTYRIPTESMAPTIPAGSAVLMNRWAKDVQRGDLLVFRFPLDPKTTLAKRVVGLPCDTIEIRDKQLFVNGAPANEPYVIHSDPVIYPREAGLPEPYASRDQFGPLVVPVGHYFVLGDNRDRSNDSRFIGPIEADAMLGRVALIVSEKGFVRPPRPPVLASLPACRSIMFAPPAEPLTTPAR
ncbi:MAG: signal peptidase I [Acidobacteria bacterium]|nr:signal peptidase I [Acidobacteriota bacterium]